jgi:hypothetical protein
VKWLLDSHVPAAVAAAVFKLQPSWSVEHVSSWQEGVWRNVDDDLLLEACHEDARVLVSKDRRTSPGWVALRASEGKDHADILFYAGGRGCGRRGRVSGTVLLSDVWRQRRDSHKPCENPFLSFPGDITWNWWLSI